MLVNRPCGRCDYCVGGGLFYLVTICSVVMQGGGEAERRIQSKVSVFAVDRPLQVVRSAPACERRWGGVRAVARGLIGTVAFTCTGGGQRVAGRLGLRGRPRPAVLRLPGEPHRPHHHRVQPGHDPDPHVLHQQGSSANAVVRVGYSNGGVFVFHRGAGGGVYCASRPTGFEASAAYVCVYSSRTRSSPSQVVPVPLSPYFSEDVLVSNRS
mmetsp:Transcript_54788/g.146452  ORF Transcript_54788/g.146452 Transcript_54788/m.146452 type:complete len:211 (+) Transcript_54788:2262-2894(+)